ncbi:MAG: DUF1553 domain-containing protein, partial [bacterium]|nr:DUF1553 domain-containing protein [bacterium]
IDPDHFRSACEELVKLLKAENGDPQAFGDTHRLNVEAPKWNPRVLDALEEAKPSSLVELAGTYGLLFKDVHLGWLKAMLEASMEAAPEAEIVTDEDPRHAEINSAINQQLRRHLYEVGSPTAVPDELAVKLLNRTVSDDLNGKHGTIHNLHLNAAGSPPRGMVLTEANSPPTFRVFLRGNPLARGDVVEPRFLTAVSPNEPTPFANGQRRLGLAKAIVDPSNPLTRRVVVNWIWRHHFGLGIVRTPDDFGTRGTPPTHPQLLDYLASIFAEDGWSIKNMHRRIMLSDVYQQAAIENSRAREIDGENRLLWRMPRRRLEMETMRDAMLAVSNELDTAKIGGRPFDFEANPIIPRRSVYGFINRDIISSLASTFDGADPTSCTVKRPHTTVPQQTLYALNSEFVQDRAAALARRVVEMQTDDRGRVDWLYRTLYARSPLQDEIQMAINFVDRELGDRQPSEAGTTVAVADASKNRFDRWAQLAHAMLASNEFVFLD